MGYLHIDNLYANQDVLLFRELYALEKIHGTGAHISWDSSTRGMSFFSGGAQHESFLEVFDQETLKEYFLTYDPGYPVTVCGEAYGGKMQGMSKTYGKELRFVAFDVKVGSRWLSVPQAKSFVENLGLEFVWYTEVPVEDNLDSINAQRDRGSMQAIRNGMGAGHPCEGVVLRPLIEVTKNNGNRIIAKHKNEAFRERKTEIPVSPDKRAALQNAEDIAAEWVTAMRLSHVAGGRDIKVEDIGALIHGMVEDIRREAGGEVVWSKECEKAIGRATALMVKQHTAGGWNCGPSR